MFDNIGEKIKSLTQILCWIFIIIYILIGVVLISIDEDLVGAGLAVMIIGPLLSWVSSFVMYGFGQIIENTDMLVYYIEKPQKKKKIINKPEGTYTDAEIIAELEKENANNQKDFQTQLRTSSTEDLILILTDQRNLYNEEELNEIEKEIRTRTLNK